MKSPTGKTLNDVSFASALNGSAVGNNGVILSTDDGGKSWRALKSPTGKTLHHVSFASALNGSAVGNNGVVLSTSDGGKSWNTRLDG